MNKITIRELRNHGSNVIQRVLAGESLVVTRDGHAVAELRPTERAPLDANTLLERWKNLPRVDGDSMQRQIDKLMDPTL